MNAPRLSTQQILDLFVERAPAVLNDRFQQDRCLNATRIVVEVMKRFSLSAQPTSVIATAMNGVYADRVRNMGREPTKVDVEEWIRIGGWAVGIDTQAAEDGKWAGHLVAVVGKDWLVDAASGQFSRPDRNLTVPDVFAGAVGPRWLKGKEGANFQGPDGSVLCYRVREGDSSWVKQPGWQASTHNLQAADEIVKSMRGRA